LIEEPFAPLFPQLLEQDTRGVTLPIANRFGQGSASDDRVKVIVENHPGMHSKLLVSAAMLQRAHENIAARSRRENRQPLDDRCGDEMRRFWLVDSIAAAHGFQRTGNGIARASTCRRLSTDPQTPPPCEMESRSQSRAQMEFGHEEYWRFAPQSRRRLASG